MDIGESSFTFKCLSCGEAGGGFGGTLMGTGTIGLRIWEEMVKGCRLCGEPHILYSEKMRYDWEDYGEKVYQKEYDEARVLYLEGRWIQPKEPSKPEPLVCYRPNAIALFIDRVYNPENFFWKCLFLFGKGLWFVSSPFVGLLIIVFVVFCIGEVVKFFG